MKSFDYYLERAGIVSHFTIDLTISAYDFASRLGNITRYSEIGFFSDLEDVFATDHRTQIKGMITDQQFRIKHKARFFDFGKHTAIASGIIIPTDNGIKVTVKMDSFKIIIFIYMIMASAYFLITTLVLILNVIFGDSWALIMVPFLFLFATITIILPFLLLRNSTRTMQDFFKNQFHYLAP